MLDLSPETESRLSECAASEGVNPDEAINRLLRSVAHTSPKPDHQTALADPVLAFLQTRITEAEQATPEEVAEADEEYQQWQRSMNETRHHNGERLLFPEVAP